MADARDQVLDHLAGGVRRVIAMAAWRWKMSARIGEAYTAVGNIFGPIASSATRRNRNALLAP